MVTGFPHIGQSLQLPALILRDYTIHHHPLGTVQDFGGHGESDTIIKQGATCKAITPAKSSSSSVHTLSIRYCLAVRKRNSRCFLFTRETSRLVASKGRVVQRMELRAEGQEIQVLVHSC